MTSLTDKAMLVQIRVHQWTARRYDREVSQEIIHDKGALSSDAGRFNKLLLPKIALAGVQTAVNAIRKHHATETLPWTINGVGLLPAANFFAYMGEYKRLALSLEVEREKFIRDYDRARSQAQIDLGDLYRADDYPDAESLRFSIGSDVNVMPLPDAGDFRVRLGDGEEKRIRAEIAASVEAAIADAVRSLWQRVHDTVSAMHTRLTLFERDEDTGKVKNPFRDSLVTNMRELVDLLGRLNVTGDAALEAMRRQLDAKLCQSEPDDLRADDTLRAAQAADCKRILDLMAPYVGAVAPIAAE